MVVGELELRQVAGLRIGNLDDVAGRRLDDVVPGAHVDRVAHIEQPFTADAHVVPDVDVLALLNTRIWVEINHFRALAGSGLEITSVNVVANGDFVDAWTLTTRHEQGDRRPCCATVLLEFLEEIPFDDPIWKRTVRRVLLEETELHFIYGVARERPCICIESFRAFMEGRCDGCVLVAVAAFG